MKPPPDAYAQLAVHVNTVLERFASSPSPEVRSVVRGLEALVGLGAHNAIELQIRRDYLRRLELRRASGVCETCGATKASDGPWCSRQLVAYDAGAVALIREAFWDMDPHLKPAYQAAVFDRRTPGTRAHDLVAEHDPIPF